MHSMTPASPWSYLRVLSLTVGDLIVIMASLQPTDASSPSKATSKSDQVSSCSCTYERMAAADLSTVESLGYVLGKTLGSGTYAKVKAAWSSAKNELVSMITSSFMSHL